MIDSFFQGRIFLIKRDVYLRAHINDKWKRHQITHISKLPFVVYKVLFEQKKKRQAETDHHIHQVL